MTLQTTGQIAFEAYCAASEVLALRGMRWVDLRPSAQRLWEASADAALHSDTEPGAAAYNARLEDTGLPVQHFVQYADLCESAQLQWEAAAKAVRSIFRRNAALA